MPVSFLNVWLKATSVIVSIISKSKKPSSRGWTSRKSFNGFKKISAIDSFYTFGEVIGEGSFGQVRLAVDNRSQE